MRKKKNKNATTGHWNISLESNIFQLIKQPYAPFCVRSVQARHFYNISLTKN
jgi:hypothetical protein